MQHGNSEETAPPVETDGDRLTERFRTADRVLLCLDFDGTLAPIVASPEAARMLPAAREPLESLADRPSVGVAVVSGRELSDVRERVAVPGVAYAGNHGLEVEVGGDRIVHNDARECRSAISELCASLDRTIGDVPGCEVEDKGLTATVHYRQVDPAHVGDVRERVERAVAERDALRRTTGKAIVEIRPAIDWGKGDAVASLADRLDDEPFVTYVGDDTTDESAFRAVRPDGVGIYVGDPGDRSETAATYRLSDPGAVAAFLDWLDGTLANADAE